jgi:hypothetical protein
MRIWPSIPFMPVSSVPCWPAIGIAVVAHHDLRAPHRVGVLHHLIDAPPCWYAGGRGGCAVLMTWPFAPPMCWAATGSESRPRGERRHGRADEHLRASHTRTSRRNRSGRSPALDRWSGKSRARTCPGRISALSPKQMRTPRRRCFISDSRWLRSNSTLPRRAEAVRRNGRVLGDVVSWRRPMGNGTDCALTACGVAPSRERADPGVQTS